MYDTSVKNMEQACVTYNITLRTPPITVTDSHRVNAPSPHRQIIRVCPVSAAGGLLATVTKGGAPAKAS
jgi:hypothetical protein